MRKTFQKTKKKRKKKNNEKTQTPSTCLSVDAFAQLLIFDVLFEEFLCHLIVDAWRRALHNHNSGTVARLLHVSN
jgi:hypothetical protein